MRRFLRQAASAALSCVCLLSFPLAPLTARAAAYPVYFDADTTLNLSGPSYNFTIISGSHMDSPTDTIAITPTTFTVTMAGTGQLIIRWPGPNPGRFVNDGGLPECTYASGNNDLVINGPVTVTFTPSAASACVAPATGGGGGSGGGATSFPSVSVASPNGGETFEGGTSVGLIWTAGGTQVTGTRLSYTADDGANWTVISDSAGGGYLSWTVPMVATTKAKIRAEALLSGGSSGATDTSDSTFTITVPPGVTGSYSTDEVTTAAPTINDDVGLKNTPPPEDALCAAGSLVKLPSDNDPRTGADSAVYYCGKDGKRYVFPSIWIYSTWYPDFSTVKVIPAATMAKIMLGGNVTYRPGVRMVKVQTDPHVYAVAAHGTLRWVTSEDVAFRLYGPDWNKKIDDVSDAFFVDYTVGEPIY